MVHITTACWLGPGCIVQHQGVSRVLGLTGVQISRDQVSVQYLRDPVPSTQKGEALFVLTSGAGSLGVCRTDGDDLAVGNLLRGIFPGEAMEQPRRKLLDLQAIFVPRDGHLSPAAITQREHSCGRCSCNSCARHDAWPLERDSV